MEKYPIKQKKKISTRDLVGQGRYDEINRLVREDKRFPMRDKFIGERNIVIVPGEGVVDTNVVISDASKKKLRRPSYEDALLFGAQHHDVKKYRRIVFLHEQTYFSGYGFYLMIECTPKKRSLRLISPGGGWRDCHFAFLSD